MIFRLSLHERAKIVKRNGILESHGMKTADCVAVVIHHSPVPLCPADKTWKGCAGQWPLTGGEVATGLELERA